MRRTVVLVALLLAGVGGLPNASAEWLPILKLDILHNTHADASYVEDGFVGWAPLVGVNQSTLNPAPVSTTIGGITITFDSGAYHQDRYRTSADLNGVPYEKMYRDTFWGRAADKVSQGLDITLAGLEANQTYLVALYCFDYADWGGLQSCDWTANGQFAFNASWNGDLPGGDKPTAWDSFRRTVVVNADAEGKVLLVSTPGAGTLSATYWATCSGIEIYVPEPGRVVSLFSVVLGVLSVRRRK